MRIDENKILNEIIKLLNERDKITSLTRYYYVTKDIYSLIYIYGRLTGENLYVNLPSNNKLDSYLRKYLGIIDINKYYYFLNQDEHTYLSTRVLDVFDKSEYIYYGRNDQMKLSEKQFFEILNDFFGTYNNRLYKLLNSSIEKGLIDTRRDDSSCASTFMKLTSNEHFVLLPKGYNAENLVVFSHELAHLDSHVVLDVRSKKQLLDSYKTYYEAYSHYMEQCMLEYLKENHILLKDTAINENNYYAWMKGYFEELNDCSNFEPDVKDYDVLDLISDAYQYGYGMYIGVLLHERYKTDKVGTIKDIDNYLFNQGLLDKEAELEVLGLKDELIDSRVLEKRLNKHNEFYRKYS